jgi:hypothetical protein
MTSLLWLTGEVAALLLQQLLAVLAVAAGQSLQQHVMYCLQVRHAAAAAAVGGAAA